MISHNRRQLKLQQTPTYVQGSAFHRILRNTTYTQECVVRRKRLGLAIVAGALLISLPNAWAADSSLVASTSASALTSASVTAPEVETVEPFTYLNPSGSAADCSAARETLHALRASGASAPGWLNDDSVCDIGRPSTVGPSAQSYCGFDGGYIIYEKFFFLGIGTAHDHLGPQGGTTECPTEHCSIYVWPAWGINAGYSKGGPQGCNVSTATTNYFPLHVKGFGISAAVSPSTSAFWSWCLRC